MFVLLAASEESYHSASLKEHGSTSGARQPGLPGNTPNAICPAVDRLAFEFLTTNPDDRRLGPTRPNPKWHAFQVPRSQAHDRSIKSLIDPSMRLLFIAAIVAPVVWEHFLL